MFNVVMDYLPEDDEVKVVEQTTSRKPPEIEPIFTGEDVERFHEVVRRVPIAEDVVRYAVRLAAATRPGRPEAPDFVNDWVSWGAGIRAAQYVVLGAKARAPAAGSVARHAGGREGPGAGVVPTPNSHQLSRRGGRRHRGKRD